MRRSYLFVSALLEAGPGSPTTNLCQQTIITIKSVIRPTIPNYYHYCQNPTMVGFWLVGICWLANINIIITTASINNAIAAIIVEFIDNVYYKSTIF